jgi:hypothetical protein
MPFEQIDPNDIRVYPLARRESFLDIRRMAADPAAAPPPIHDALAEQLDVLAGEIRQARSRGAAVMLAYGAHLIKNGGAPLLRALLAGGWITHLATHGAGIIHDWEFAFAGLSSESVRDNVPAGRFGQWDETGKAINLALLVGGCAGLGFGEAIGRLIVDDGLELPEPDRLAEQIAEAPEDPLTGARADLLAVMRRFQLSGGRWRLEHAAGDLSATAAAADHGVPLTVHPGIGYDIFTNHPMFCGAAIGRAAGIDARIFARSVRDLTGGVYLSVGSAIMSPQVFEKALSLANDYHLARCGRGIYDHTIGVIDIQPGGDWDWTSGEPPKDHPAYYLRFCKSFYRMGGDVRYLCCDNVTALGHLLSRLG